ncbi:MAG: excisionase [Firmicutes bacterium]|nr:excisionase [Bacillota bacterium]
MNNENVPIWNKACLTIQEAAEYTNIGINSIEKMLNNDNCDFTLFVGRKRLIKQRAFEEFLARVSEI